MRKLKTLEKNLLKKYYIENHNNLLWFLAYGTGGVCFVKYIPLIFKDIERSVLADLEEIGFIKYDYYRSYKLLVVKSALYDHMELSEEDLQNKKRIKKSVKVSIQNINRSAMVCDYYLYLLKMKYNHNANSLINKMQKYTNLCFLEKRVDIRFLNSVKKIFGGSVKHIYEVDKHICVIEKRFELLESGRDNLKINQLKQEEKEIAIIERQRGKSAEEYNKPVKKDKVDFYDLLVSEKIINTSEKENWVDLYILSLRKVFLTDMKNIFLNENKRVYNINFTILVNPDIRMTTIIQNMKDALYLAQSLLIEVDCSVSFDIVSSHLTKKDIQKLYKMAIDSDKALLEYSNNECLNYKLITPIESDYTNIPTLDKYLYEDDLI